MQIMFDMEHFCPYRAEVYYHKVCQICACERIQNKKKVLETTAHTLQYFDEKCVV